MCWFGPRCNLACVCEKRGGGRNRFCPWFCVWGPTGIEWSSALRSEWPFIIIIICVCVGGVLRSHTVFLL